MKEESDSGLVKCPECTAKCNKPYCWNCDSKITDDYYKCRSCGTKYVESWVSETDTSVCKWCNGELLYQKYLNGESTLNQLLRGD